MKLEAVRRILKAAANGRGGDKMPDLANVNLRELVCALEGGEFKYHTAHQLKSGAHARKRIRALSLIGKTAKRLLLVDREHWEEIASSSLYPLEFGDPIEVLRCLAKIADGLCKPKSFLPLRPEVDRRLGARAANALGIGRKSAFEWLIGEYLPPVFEQHSGLEVKCRYGDNPDTPYVRFAEAFLDEARIRTPKGPKGRPYTREAIVKAVSDGRKDRRGGRAHGQTGQKKIKVPRMTGAVSLGSTEMPINSRSYPNGREVNPDRS
jgi:hypothetical protein